MLIYFITENDMKIFILVFLALVSFPVNASQSELCITAGKLIYSKANQLSFDLYNGKITETEAHKQYQQFKKSMNAEQCFRYNHPGLS